MNKKHATLLLTIVGSVLVVGATALFFLLPKNSMPSINNIPDSRTDENITDINGSKLYHNEKQGFEFQYQKNWEIQENNVRSASSRFNLTITPIGEPYQPLPPILLNIVSPEFAEHAFQDLKNNGKIIEIDGIQGVRYDYTESGNVQRISIILPLADNQLILGAGKGYEQDFNNILSTFKFLKGF